MKQKTSPPMYRLTLAPDAFAAVAGAVKGPISLKAAIHRPDGKWDCAITFSLLDQLKTAAFPEENLSDTVLRIMAKAKGLN